MKCMLLLPIVAFIVQNTSRTTVPLSASMQTKGSTGILPCLNISDNALLLSMLILLVVNFHYSRYGKMRHRQYGAY